MRYLGNLFCFGKKEMNDVQDEEAKQEPCEGSEKVEEETASSRLVPASSASSVAASSLATQLQGRYARNMNRTRKRKTRKGVKFLIIGGLLNLIMGILSLVWTPFSIAMNERLKMTPGLPPYEWWRSPPDEVFLSVYLFNVTNGPEFLNGTDSKLRFQEVGPFVFLEKLEHDNVTHNNNGTLTYTARRTALFRPELTVGDLNDTLVVPNVAVLGIASYLHNSPFFTKFGYNLLLRRLGSQPLSTLSIYNYLWNYTDPLLHTARRFAPFLVPVTNMGILSRIYSDFRDEITVYVGPENEQRFFTMDQFHGRPRFGFWPEERCDTVKGATEGVTYHQSISRNDSLMYFRKTICRVTPVRYIGDLVRDGLDAYRFELPDNIFDRTEDRDEDCFAGTDEVPLQSGLTDLSPCFYDLPMAASAPHFLNGDPSLIDSVAGLRPERDKHVSYVIVEPITGIPMESCARIQSNLVMRSMAGLSTRVEKFSDIVIPMFWAEYHQVGLPWYVYYLMYFTVMILPDLQTCISLVLLISGSAMLVAGSVSVMCARRKKQLDSYSSLDLLPSTSSTDS